MKETQISTGLRKAKSRGRGRPKRRGAPRTSKIPAVIRHRLKQARYRRNHPEIHREQQKRYRANHPEIHRRQQQRYRANHSKTRHQQQQELQANFPVIQQQKFHINKPVALCQAGKQFQTFCHIQQYNDSNPCSSQSNSDINSLQVLTIEITSLNDKQIVPCPNCGATLKAE